MRLRTICPLLAAAMLASPAAASASFPHVVAAGESLTSVAATDGLSVAELAAANGISPDSQLIAGSTLLIPPQGSSAGVASAGTSSAPASSSAAVSSPFSSSSGGYLVQPGDTLSAIAARAGISVSQLAASNGLDPNGVLLAGSTLSLSGSSAGSSSGTSAPVSTSSGSSSSGSGGYLVQPGDTLSAIAARAGMSVAELAAANGLDPSGILYAGSTLHLSGSSSSGSSEFVSTTPSSGSTSSPGGYLVQPGDTLSAIAARAGMSVSALASINGLNPDGILPAGATLRLPGAGAPVLSTGAEGQPVGTPAEGNPTDPPYPTPERVSASEVGSIASANGVPASLAQAIGWQESGFNNDLVSSADARGVMQILPGTWDWIQRTLTAGRPLAPATAADNVRGGVLLLRSLLNSTGSTSMAAAGYYQGLSSVQQHGLYSDTQQYVNSVMSLERQFGGG
jgi:N-acetylmuramoyl-L-alanine amidase